MKIRFLLDNMKTEEEELSNARLLECFMTIGGSTDEWGYVDMALFECLDDMMKEIDETNKLVINNRRLCSRLYDTMYGTYGVDVIELTIYF